jgi:parvulin-like peptidyl-prolyl isomerase
VAVSRRVLAALLFSASFPVVAFAGSAEPKPAAPAPAAAPAGGKVASPATSASKAPATDAKPASADADAPMSAYVKAPLFDGRFGQVPVATVDDDVITLTDLGEALATTHEDRARAGKADTKSLEAVLNRLISVRLIALEARDMGFDQVDEVKTELDRFNDVSLRQVLQQKVTKDVKGDPAEVKAIYEEMAREWKVRSLLIEKEDDAKAARAEMQKGKGFEEVAKALLAAKKAKGGADAEYMVRDGMLPVVRDAVERAEVKVPSAPFKTPSGWVVLQVDEVKTAEDPKKREQAEQIAASRAHTKALQDFYNGLRKKYLKETPGLLKRIDYEAKKPGYRAYEKDKRVLAQIAGEKPITVADLTAELEKKFFHGIEKAIEEKSVNAQKVSTYEAMIYKRIFTKEALLERIQDSDEYKRTCAEYATSVLFTAFLNKIIIPDVKVEEAEALKYYESHKADYTYPALYRLDTITFPDQKLAQATLDKVTKGTDFKFLKGSTEGQVPFDDQVLRVDGAMPVTAKSLPADLAKLLSSTKRGDYRLYAGRRNQYSVVQVLEVTPSEIQPFENAKDDILKKLFNQNAEKLVQDWAAKLRNARDVKIFVQRVGA